MGEVDKEVANKWEGDKDTPRVDAALLGMVSTSSSPIMELREGQPSDLEERTVTGGGWIKLPASHLGRVDKVRHLAERAVSRNN